MDTFETNNFKVVKFPQKYDTFVAQTTKCTVFLFKLIYKQNINYLCSIFTEIYVTELIMWVFLNLNNIQLKLKDSKIIFNYIPTDII